MKRRFQTISIILLVSLHAGCGMKQEESAHQPTPKQSFIASAKAIASDPSNWKSNSKLLIDFSGAAVDLHWSDKAEVRDFKANVLDLISFSTTWIDRLDQVESRKFAEGVTHIVASVDSKLPSAPGVAQVIVNRENVEKQAESALSSSTSKLQAAQAEQFGRLFGRVVDSYEKIYKLGTTE